MTRGLTKRSATPDSTQRAIVRAIRGGGEEVGQAPPAEDGEPEIGQGRHQGDEHQPRFTGGVAIGVPTSL
jgi:hypothetical protein